MKSFKTKKLVLGKSMVKTKMIYMVGTCYVVECLEYISLSKFVKKVCSKCVKKCAKKY